MTVEQQVIIFPDTLKSLIYVLTQNEKHLSAPPQRSHFCFLVKGLDNYWTDCLSLDFHLTLPSKVKLTYSLQNKLISLQPQLYLWLGTIHIPTNANTTSSTSTWNSYICFFFKKKRKKVTKYNGHCFKGGSCSKTWNCLEISIPGLKCRNYQCGLKKNELTVKGNINNQQWRAPIRHCSV